MKTKYMFLVTIKESEHTKGTNNLCVNIVSVDSQGVTSYRDIPWYTSQGDRELGWYGCRLQSYDFKSDNLDSVLKTLKTFKSFNKRRDAIRKLNSFTGVTHDLACSLLALFEVYKPKSVTLNGADVPLFLAWHTIVQAAMDSIK